MASSIASRSAGVSGLARSMSAISATNCGVTGLTVMLMTVSYTVAFHSLPGNAMPQTYKLALLDDYQKVALKMADWDRLKKRGVKITVFHAPFTSVEDAAKKLAPFDMLGLLRERTAFPRALIASARDAVAASVPTAARHSSWHLSIGW